MKKQNHVLLAMLIALLSSILAAALCFYCYHRTENEWIRYVTIVCVAVAAHVLIMYICAPIVSLTFRKKYKYMSLWFRQKEFEKTLYKWLRVRKWKVKLPAYDSKEYSLQENDPETIIHNMCHAEIVHELIIAASYLPVLLGKLFSNYWLLLTLSFIFSSAHLAFVIIQRYNRPRIIRILEKTKRTA